jgi:ATP-dependent 26S proteasome regulatory subunit
VADRLVSDAGPGGADAVMQALTERIELPLLWSEQERALGIN